MFETGVDEMSWDDTENYRMGGSYQWPALADVVEYRRKVIHCKTTNFVYIYQYLRFSSLNSRKSLAIMLKTSTFLIDRCVSLCDQ